MAVTLKQTEGVPASYPTVTGLSDEADALDKDALWQRLEGYCAHRWTSRTVVWLVEGCGHWKAPLTPSDVSLVESWDGSTFQTVTPNISPFGGYDFGTDGPHKITATVGDAVTCPAAVQEAFRRLAEYSAEITGADGGNTSYSVTIGGIAESYRRGSGWAGKALQNSGAADLLRLYRRA